MYNNVVYTFYGQLEKKLSHVYVTLRIFVKWHCDTHCVATKKAQVIYVLKQRESFFCAGPENIITYFCCVLFILALVRKDVFSALL